MINRKSFFTVILSVALMFSALPISARCAEGSTAAPAQSAEIAEEIEPADETVPTGENIPAGETAPADETVPAGETVPTGETVPAEDPSSPDADEIDRSGGVYRSGEPAVAQWNGLDNEEMFEQYAQSLFENKVKTGTSLKKAGRNTGNRLTGQNKAIYNAIARDISAIASGEKNSSVFDVYLDEMGIDTGAVYTAKELGVDWLYDPEKDELNPELDDVMAELFTFDLSKIRECLLADYPYEMYWCNGTIHYYRYPSYAANKYYLWFGSDVTQISLEVENQYRAVQGTNSIPDIFTLDTDKTGAAANACGYARSVVNNAASKSDVDKLTYYKDTICQLVTYNTAAAENSTYYVGQNYGPWALIYVFDRDAGTNVVCEGYSKAFQYLCDMTSFDNPSIAVYSVKGYMEGVPHEWNTVHMEDGRNYIADITNSDAGAWGSDGRLFLKGMEGSAAGGYYTKGAEHVFYKYGTESLGIFTENELTYSYFDYGEEEHHEYGNWVTVLRKTCDADGLREKTCSICGDIVTETIPAGHTWNTYYTTDIRPTLHSPGIKSIHCKYCGAVKNAVRIPVLINVARAKTSSLTNRVYTGKAISPAPKVVLNKYTLVRNTDYTITYKNNKAVGTATVTITGKGRYGGQLRKTFRINPKGTGLAGLTAGRKKVTVKWKKQTVQTSGYMVQYTTDKNFKKNLKAVTKSGNKNVSVTVSNLTSGKRYYFRVRTFKKAGSAKYYSSWSAAGSAVVK